MSIFTSAIHFNREITAPFNELPKKTEEVDCLSCLNEAKGRNRCATLVETYLAAAKEILFYLSESAGYYKFGYIPGDGDGPCISFVETIEREGSSLIIRYDPLSGKFHGSTVTSKVMFASFPALVTRSVDLSKGRYGTALVAAMIYSHMSADTDYGLELRKAVFSLGDDLEKTRHEAAYRLCDNIYRGLNRGLYKTTLRGNIVFNLLKTDLQEPEFKPVDGGPFEIFSLRDSKPEKTVSRKRASIKETEEEKKPIDFRTISTMDAAKAAFGLNLDLEPEEKILIPKMDSSYRISKEVTQIASMVKQAGMRRFLMYGPAGTGKSTDAKAIAEVLGLPYRFFTCSDSTDEMELVAAMTPNTRGLERSDKRTYPSLEDIWADPIQTLKKFSPKKYQETITEAEAFQEICQTLFEMGYNTSRQEKDFVMVKSPIVKGCERPCVVEIQEPATIAKPGVLVRLNGMLDDTAQVLLPDGTIIDRNPNTIFILTTNVDYAGCRAINESVISRMDMSVYKPLPDAEEQLKRVMAKTGMKEKEIASKMVSAIAKIAEYCKQNFITGGVCGGRELEAWIRSYMVSGDVMLSAESTVITKISFDIDVQEEIRKVLGTIRW